MTAGQFVELAGGRHDVVLAGSTEGLWKYAANELTRIANLAPIALAVGPESELFASDETSVDQLDGDAWTPLPLDKTLTHGMLVDHKGQLWVGDNGHFGRWSIAGRAWTSYEAAAELAPNERVLSLLLDHERNPWLGTGGRGILELSRMPLNALGPSFEGNESATSVACDSAGQIYATAESFWKVVGEEIVELPGARLFAIATAREGGLWSATAAGLERLAGDARRPRRARPSCGSRPLFSCTRARSTTATA